MRLTRIAVILQSASFFVSILAVHTMPHIMEHIKEFDCSGRRFQQREYAQLTRTELTGPVNQYGWTMDKIYNDLLSDRSNYNLSAFQDDSDSYHKFYELETTSQRHEISRGYVIYAYILVTNQHGFVNAMIRRRESHVGRQDLPDTYSICQIAT
ncbi:BgtE-20020 [Blumeria graminis f. sp. tritici]|uniref:BgtE-20020 n=3 Tax=Blumeria graminis TaxID=34373 RepID=A0A381L7G0_BLUGR|nr:BgtE-20020 [Blumeria graminis f. sp. tritici]